MTYREVHQRSIRLSCSLARVLHLPERTFVGVLSHNRPEWYVADIAVVLGNMVAIGLHTTWSVDDLRYAINHAGLRCVFAESGDVLRILIEALIGPSGDRPCVSHCPLVKSIIIIDNCRQSIPNLDQDLEGLLIKVYHLDDLLGEAVHESHKGEECSSVCGMKFSLGIYTTPPPIDRISLGK
jgi:long-subunit acyl-CoA synthetase (AMP-forming)